MLLLPFSPNVHGAERWCDDVFNTNSTIAFPTNLMARNNCGATLPNFYGKLAISNGMYNRNSFSYA